MDTKFTRVECGQVPKVAKVSLSLLLQHICIISFAAESYAEKWEPGGKERLMYLTDFPSNTIVKNLTIGKYLTHSRRLSTSLAKSILTQPLAGGNDQPARLSISAEMSQSREELRPKAKAKAGFEVEARVVSLTWTSRRLLRFRCRNVTREKRFWRRDCRTWLPLICKNSCIPKQ